MQSPVLFPSQEPVGGRYELLHRVGEGNFSITYRARDVILDRNVAVKVLREQFAADETFVSRFEREARVAASVSHPNVVDVYDFGPVGKTYYIAMQYVAGRTLKEELDARGRIPPPDAIRFATQILQGLAAIHAAGIVHRDIKPQNVLLGQDELARVTDFGVAHYPLQGALTTHGTTVGTASYMAPEQARGGALTEATDLYAVGVVLFELLTGRLPFEADNPMAVMLAHLQQPAPSLSDVAPELQLSPSLQSVVARALSKDPTARYPSAGDMSEALAAAAIAPNEVTAAPPFDAAEQTQTVQVPVVSAAGAATTAGAAASQGSANAVGPRTAMPSLPPVRRDQRAAGWLAPLLLFGLALIAGAGLLVSANGLPFGDGDGNGDDDPPAVAGVADATARPSAVSPATTATAVPTPRSLRAVAVGEPTATAGPTGATDAVPAAEETPPPISTATMAPHQEPTLPPPTATAAPSPTATSEPEPTATAPPPTPLPVPTQTPEAEEVVPDPGVIAPADGEGSSTNPDGGIVPVQVDEPAANDQTISFTSRDWRGALAGDQSWYGRPWVALYGRDGGYARATLRFDLETAPGGRMVLTIAGLGDETGAPFPFALEVNGVSFGEVGATFLNWNPAEHGARGEQAPWSQIELNIPRDVFQAGRNEITIVSLKPGANESGTPYILLSDATLTPSGSGSAAGPEIDAGGASQPIITNVRNTGSEKSKRPPGKEKEKGNKDD